MRSAGMSHRALSRSNSVHGASISSEASVQACYRVSVVVIHLRQQLGKILLIYMSKVLRFDCRQYVTRFEVGGRFRQAQVELKLFTVCIRLAIQER
jgi:hypothetical protein